MRWLTLLIFLCYAGALRAAAEAGQPGGYLRAGVGARAAALGQAGTPLISGPDAVYWNPAALALGRRPALGSSLSLLSLGRRFTSASMHWVWDPAPQAPGPGAYSLALRSGVGAWGLGWIDFSLGDDFEGRVADTAGYYSFGDRQNAYLLSHARPLTTWLAVGLGARFYQRAIERFNAHGQGYDAGLLILLGPHLRLGLSASDLFGALNWSTGYRERIPPWLRAGLSADWKGRLRWSGQASAVEGRSPDLGTGLELKVVEGVWGRAGWHRDGPTFGGGLELPVSSSRWAFNYAYLPDPLRQGDVQRMEIQVYF